ncbi:MAG: hypothetical protein ACUVQ0_04185 [Thermoproteota archaeon]
MTLRKFLGLSSSKFKILRADKEEHYELVTPVVVEMIAGKAVHGDIYRTIYDLSNKKYVEISNIFLDCLKQNINGRDFDKTINLYLQKYPDLISAINKISRRREYLQTDSENILIFLRILESKARSKYHEYTLKLNSIISLFFFCIFLVPTPIFLTLGFVPQLSRILLSLFFTSSMIIFRVFYDKIGRIRSILLG